jgi:hypothetical protein
VSNLENSSHKTFLRDAEDNERTPKMLPRKWQSQGCNQHLLSQSSHSQSSTVQMLLN